MARPANQDQLFSKTQILFCVICMVLMQTDFVQAQDYHCEVEISRKCISKVTWTIQEKYAEKGKSFTIAYRTTEGKTDTAVLLHYVGYYLCEAAGEHTCDEGNNSTSLNRNTTACVTNRTYTIAADGEDDMPCTPAQTQTEPSGSNPCKDKQNATDCSTDTLADNYAIIGISCTCALLTLFASVVFFWCCRRRYRKHIKNDIAHATDQEGKEETEKETFLAEVV
ncbi:uncharacterized protein LOC112568059 [Pomacea canaliculata]|uniref:uncharacterized protein LOC112568059 n=1 Tax=Pomacea canaliculata TaxID=400727 RepID=UPI000D73FBCC|nr:uncharacterized protein LOC112568059 [Pomacea canaliculata]